MSTNKSRPDAAKEEHANAIAEYDRCCTGALSKISRAWTEIWTVLVS